jgi:hypothetical protein
MAGDGWILKIASGSLCAGGRAVEEARVASERVGVLHATGVHAQRTGRQGREIVEAVAEGTTDLGGIECRRRLQRRLRRHAKACRRFYGPDEQSSRHVRFGRLTLRSCRCRTDGFLDPSAVQQGGLRQVVETLGDTPASPAVGLPVQLRRVKPRAHLTGLRVDGVELGCHFAARQHVRHP